MAPSAPSISLPTAANGSGSGIDSVSSVVPRIIIHGGAGNIKRDNLPPASYAAYRSSLLRILRSADALLSSPTATALDVATHAVSLLEDDELFNCGRGAVFTRAGTIELEASIMVSRGRHKRGVGCMLLRQIKNPIRLAREVLVRGDQKDGGGAGGHCQLSGQELERLAVNWGCETRPFEYFWTQKRWDQHRKGLDEDGLGENLASPIDVDSNTYSCVGDPGWDGHEYLPQGTVGCVVLDRTGTLCVATSTGGLTNKSPGRIGDTPTLGAGFWAEEWEESVPKMLYTPRIPSSQVPSPANGDVLGLLADCLPALRVDPPPSNESQAVTAFQEKQPSSRRRAMAVSGTGNGDSFLRTSACRTAGAICRFSYPSTSLGQAVTQIAGPDGELQKSAGDRWGVTGEGEGGIIGIDIVGNAGKIVYDFNCGGMFRAWIDEKGKEHMMVFKDHY